MNPEPKLFERRTSRIVVLGGPSLEDKVIRACPPTAPAHNGGQCRRASRRTCSVATRIIVMKNNIILALQPSANVRTMFTVNHGKPLIKRQVIFH